MSQNLWCQNTALFTTSFTPWLLYMLVQQPCCICCAASLCIALLSFTSPIWLLSWTYLFCLLALNTPPRCPANKGFFLPTSCSFILPDNAAIMQIQVRQGLSIWAQCLAHPAKSHLVPGWLGRGPWRDCSLVGFSCRLTKPLWIVEHQLYMEGVFCTICLRQVNRSI